MGQGELSLVFLATFGQGGSDFGLLFPFPWCLFIKYLGHGHVVSEVVANIGSRFHWNCWVSLKISPTFLHSKINKKKKKTIHISDWNEARHINFETFKIKGENFNLYFVSLSHSRRGRVDTCVIATGHTQYVVPSPP